MRRRTAIATLEAIAEGSKAAAVQVLADAIGNDMCFPVPSAVISIRSPAYPALPGTQAHIGARPSASHIRMRTDEPFG